MSKMLVYIAGPFRSHSIPYDQFEQHHNILRAEKEAWMVWSLGGVGVCPHKNTEHFQGSLPDETWLEGDLEVLNRCDAIYMIEGWEKSEGSRRERKFALQRGIPVLYSIKEVARLLQPSHSACKDGSCGFLPPEKGVSG